MQRYKFIWVKQELLYIQNIYIFYYAVNIYIVYYQEIIYFINLYFSFIPKKEFT